MKKVRLDQLVVARGLAESREMAQRLILAGEVSVNGQPATKAGHAFPEDAEVSLAAKPRFVSRGGEKLEGAFVHFGFSVEGLDCLDVGASTGGFTDCLLQHGAARVAAVDVGHDQFHQKLKDDPRVWWREGFNARLMKSEDLPFVPAFATCDVSFISLRLILPPIAHVLAPGGSIVTLIKPQFEAGREQVGKGGVVRDEAVREQVVDAIRAFGTGELGLEWVGVCPSPIKGPAGNVEFTALWRKPASSLEGSGQTCGRDEARPSQGPEQASDWRWQLAHAVTTLADRGASRPECAAVEARYPSFATPYWLRLMERTGIPDGPAARQALPDPRELDPPAPGECDDPFGETPAPPLPGLVHRFPDRVLVVVSRACAMRCRHCTRKNLLGAHAVPGEADLARIRDYVLAHPAVREVLLSGGDPLLLDDDALAARVDLFAALPQIDAVRIGTRVPCTLPMRVTEALAKRLGASRKVWVNTQFNHVSEITDEAAAACARLVDAGIPVSNQAVLLKGVNDTADDLVALFCGLQRIRVRPYYLFVCDPVTGTSHFRVSEARAAELEEEVAARVGGLALPRFVRDVPGAPRKVPVSARP